MALENGDVRMRERESVLAWAFSCMVSLIQSCVFACLSLSWSQGKIDREGQKAFILEER